MYSDSERRTLFILKPLQKNLWVSFGSGRYLGIILILITSWVGFQNAESFDEKPPGDPSVADSEVQEAEAFTLNVAGKDYTLLFEQRSPLDDETKRFITEDFHRIFDGAIEAEQYTKVEPREFLIDDRTVQSHTAIWFRFKHKGIRRPKGLDDNFIYLVDDDKIVISGQIVENYQEAIARFVDETTVFEDLRKFSGSINDGALLSRETVMFADPSAKTEAEEGLSGKKLTELFGGRQFRAPSILDIGTVEEWYAENIPRRLKGKITADLIGVRKGEIVDFHPIPLIHDKGWKVWVPSINE